MTDASDRKHLWSVDAEHLNACDDQHYAKGFEASGRTMIVAYVQIGSNSEAPLLCGNVRWSCRKPTFNEDIVAETQQLADAQELAERKIIADERIEIDVAEPKLCQIMPQ